MLKWKKLGRSFKGDGSSTTKYEAKGKKTWYRIESRKRPIQDEKGYRTYTRFHLIVEGQPELVYWRLMDAKAEAERLEGQST